MHTQLRLVPAVIVAAWLAVPGASLLAQAPAPAATGAKTWIGQETRVADELRNGEVVTLEEIGVGVTQPRRAYLKPGGLVESFTWKPLSPGVRRGSFESYKSEIAAYELDRLLGLNMVPPVIERSLNGATGAAVMWVSPTTSAKQLGGRIPAGRVPGREIRRMLMFDNFIGNPDRNAGNILIDEANNIILIDHSRAFTPKKDLRSKVERVDSVLWDAMQRLQDTMLREKLEPLVGGPAVDAMLERRSRMQQAVEELVAGKGEAAVIIPPDR